MISHNFRVFTTLTHLEFLRNLVFRATVRGVNHEYRRRAKGRPAGSREAQRIYFRLSFFSLRLSSIYTPANRPRDPVEVIFSVRVFVSLLTSSILVAV